MGLGKQTYIAGIFTGHYQGSLIGISDKSLEKSKVTYHEFSARDDKAAFSHAQLNYLNSSLDSIEHGSSVVAVKLLVSLSRKLPNEGDIVVTMDSRFIRAGDNWHFSEDILKGVVEQNY